ncbi:DUF6428 family protein [Brevifollis gellanilyticus]|uniref:Uncharacterized protein n=1 Tax=Brevifollis gellanilyticus TaxID=748831 RepID=A0A512MJE6_9BACT|nr:DUF6428 family protein [Brevifollis gellanilyticus]GEP46411.1 hypothetical protein BGE01nite_57020 [Brevifollis gellanilyticus]
MNITDFLTHLRAHAEKPLSFRLPDGSFVAPHYHITEVGHVLKRFIDCGGTARTLETCLLQTWVHDDVDHRLYAGKLATIFDKAGEVLPHHDLPVEVEHEEHLISQYPVESAAIVDGALTFTLGLKHTDCLARELCTPESCGPAPKQEKENEAAAAAASSCCTPGTKCC